MLNAIDNLGFRLGFGEPDPCDFGVGEDHGRNALRLEDALLAGDDLRSDDALASSLVSEHRLADQIADGEDVRVGGTQLIVYFDKALFIDGAGTTGLAGTTSLAGTTGLAGILLKLSVLRVPQSTMA